MSPLREYLIALPLDSSTGYFLAFFCEFGLNRGWNRDVQHISETNEVNLDISEFFGDALPTILVQDQRFLLCQPLEDLEQFSPLSCECHGEVLRRVERFPVSGCREGPQPLLQVKDVEGPSSFSSHDLPPEHHVAMPLQELTLRAVLHPGGKKELRPGHREVVLAIVEVLFEALADLESMIRGHC